MRFPQHLLTIDFETFWSSEYTLDKLSTEEYVRHPQFKVHGAAIKYGDAPSVWYNEEELPGFFSSVPWEDTAVLAQHAHFDGLILSHHYGVKPALWLDTLSMSNMLLPRERHSLAKLADYFGLPPKGREVHLTKGIRDLPPLILEQLALYATRGTEGHGGDADLTHAIFYKMLPDFPLGELIVVDKTIRMFTEPKLVLNRQRARDQLAKVIRNKRSALQRLGVTKYDLSSTDKFSKILEDRFGIEVALKEGKPNKDGSPKFIPALAKTDAFMKGLLEYDDPDRTPEQNADIQALASTRLAVKSTLEETRLRRLLATNERGPLTVYLNYSKAHTQRWSGGDQMNYQNLTRGSELRKTIEAPEGYVLVVSDKAQIEARILNTLAEQWDVVELFANGDPYSHRATKMFGRPVDRKKNPEDVPLGQIGKVCELGLGFGMGDRKLQRTLAIGAMGAPVTKIPLETAAEWVMSYRTDHDKVVAYWGQAGTAIELLADRARAYPWGPFMLDNGYVWHPSGVRLDYTGLYRDGGEWRLKDKAGKTLFNQFGEPIRLYGGLMTENIVQWSARTNMAEDIMQMAEDGALDRWPLVLNTHDELVLMAPENEAQECLAYMIAVMSRTPKWLPRAKLKAEGGYAREYSK